MLCKYHSQTIIKVQQPSLRPLCEKCINQNQGQKKIRLQSMRANLNKQFNSTLKQLQTEKVKLDKLIELFVGKNMTQAKKIVNKKSLQAQKLVQTTLQNQIKLANSQLKAFLDQQMSKYYQLQSHQQICELHFEFDEDFLQIQEKVTNKKKQLKKQVIQKLKQQMRDFYAKLFQF